MRVLSGLAPCSLALMILAGCAGEGGLELTLLDGATGRPTPARVELLDADGRAVVPDDALPVFGDCGSLPVHNWIPWTASLQTLWNRRTEVWNPYAGTRQFYSRGSNAVRLAPGRYTVRATKGIEYRIARAEVDIAPGASEHLVLELHRWIDLPSRSWYGADDHLHIPRPAAGFDRQIAVWMQAEDLHVANMLQMGLAQDVHVTPQRGFGSDAIYREGETLIASGQENPRTHVLGHSIILGARHWLDDPASYLLYDRLWQLAHEQGAVNGYAHWGAAGAEEGLALWGHKKLLDFIEVLNFGVPHYQRWYEALNLGVRLTPTAGTDYPCLPGLPGRERFYARLDGPLDYESWLEAVRRGRTFVTNGPVVELAVAAAGVGQEVRLPGPGPVAVRGAVRFDPARDDVQALELIRAGDVALRVEAPSGAGEYRIQTTVHVEQSTWLALRATGLKRGETELDPRGMLQEALILPRKTNDGLLASLPEWPAPRASAAHTAAIFVTVAGSPPLAEQAKAKAVIESWLDRLAELEDRFGDERIGEMAGFPGRGDGVSRADILAHREALLTAIDATRKTYLGRNR